MRFMTQIAFCVMPTMGWLYVICIEKEVPREVGTMVALILHFAHAGEIVVTAPVVNRSAAMETRHEHGAMDESDTGNESLPVQIEPIVGQ